MKQWSPIPPVSDREFWQRAAATAYGSMMTAEAEELLSSESIVPTEALYRESFITRNRAKYEDVYLEHNRKLRVMAIASLLDPRKEFIDKFSELLDISVNRMNTWILPAHDRYPHTTIPQVNVSRQIVTTDLVSLDVASGLTIAVGALKALLDPQLVADFKKEAARQVFTPITLIARNRRPCNYWMILKHNWNAVCYCNTVLAFLAAEDVSEADRKLVVDFALKRVKYFLTGFNDDGYCQEGPGYFGYGFGHFTYLAWALYESSGHKINLFADERVANIAAFPEKMMLSENLLPLFCDCHPKVFIRRDLMEIRDYLTGKSDAVNFLPPRMKETGRPQDLTLSQQLMLLGFSKSEQLRTINLPAYDAFPQTGVFVWRGDDFSFCMKGGHNQEFHNHNDIGSYVLVHNDRAVLLDPGQPRYNMDSFHSGKSYVNKLRSSYGHPVPVCNGSLQLFGRASAAVVEQCDENGAILNLSAAYRNSGAVQVRRQVEIDRQKKQVKLTDTAGFSQPGEFAVPLITFGKWEIVSPGKLRIYRDGEWEIFCTAAASGEYEISDELIDEDILFDEPVRRILFSFKEKADDFRLELTLAPGM